jgi:hypothetical protein
VSRREDGRSDSSGGSAWSWLALGTATGILWTLARARILALVEVRRGFDPELSAWRIAGEMPRTGFLLVLLALATTFVLRLWATRGRASRWMVWATALAGTWLGLVGGPWTATHRRLDLVAWPDLTRLSWLLSMAAAAALLLGGLARA